MERKIFELGEEVYVNDFGESGIITCCGANPTDLFCCYRVMLESGVEVFIRNQRIESLQMIYESVDYEENDIFVNVCAHMYHYNEGVGLPDTIRVGKKSKRQLWVELGANELPGYPHMHVYKDINERNCHGQCACLEFKDNAIYKHANHTLMLDKKELKSVNKRLKSLIPPDTIQDNALRNYEHAWYESRHIPEEEQTERTWWKYLVYLWNVTNPNCLIDLDTPIVTYDIDTMIVHSDIKNKLGGDSNDT